MEIAEPSKELVKEQAKTLKKFCSFVKRKLHRENIPRSRLFRRLQSLVYDPDEKDSTWHIARSRRSACSALSLVSRFQFSDPHGAFR